MKIRLCLVCLLEIFFVWSDPVAQVNNQPVNRDALVGQVANVKFLNFDTNNPVHYLRLVIDGKEVASDSFRTNASSGVKLAVIIPPDSKSEFEVYYEVSHMGGYMKGAFRRLQEDNVGQSEYFGPGKKVMLDGNKIALNAWTLIYEYSQHYSGGAKPLYDLRFEVM